MHKVKEITMNVTGMKNTNSPNQAELFKNQVELRKKNQEGGSFAQRLGRLKQDESKETEGRGTVVLTKEQLLMLKEKYDAENMDEKEFYDFLMDLIDLKVLSKKEVKEELVRKMAFTSMVMPAYDYYSYGTDTLSPGNYLMRFMNDIHYSEYVLEMIRQGKCQVGASDSLGTVRMMYENDLRNSRKIQGILQQLKSDPPRTRQRPE